MLTITLRPVHVAIAAAFLAGILIAAIVVLSSGGGDSPEPVTADTGNVTEPSPTTAPTSTPTPEPTDVPEPTSIPEPEPTSAPEIRSCEAIQQAGTYNSEEERQFFLDNCTTNEAPAQPPPTGGNQDPAPPSGNPTAQEALYRDRAEGTLSVFAVKLGQYLNTPLLGGLNDILEFGAVVRRQTQDMDRLPDPPPRFKQVHDQLRASLISYADYIITVVNLDLFDLDEINDWLDAYFDAGDVVVAAIEDYALVVGFDVPPNIVE